MLVKMYIRAICLAPLFLSGGVFAAPYLFTRQDERLIDQLYDEFQEWRRQNFQRGNMDPQPEMVSSPELPGETQSTPKLQPDTSPSNPEIEIIIEAPAECSDSPPNIPSTSPWKTPEKCSQLATSGASRQKIIPLDCSNRRNDKVRILEQKKAIEAALQSFFPVSSGWKAEFQLCGVLYYTASLTPPQIEKLQSIIDPPAIVLDGSIEPPLEPGASSANDARYSPSDTRIQMPSGENRAPPLGPFWNDQKPTEIYPKHPEPEKEQQLNTPSPFSSPVSREQSGEQRESRLYAGESTLPNDNIERQSRQTLAGT